VRKVSIVDEKREMRDIHIQMTEGEKIGGSPLLLLLLLLLLFFLNKKKTHISNEECC